MQRMIRQFAAEYTSKTSSTQDSSSPNSTKNQSLLKASLVASSPVGATAQNPVLSKLLMADQDSPLDLTVRKSQLDPSEQDGVLDLSTKKSPCAGSASLSHSAGCSATPGNGEGTTEAIDCPGQPKSPLEKFMVRLCTYHQKRFVHVLNDICTEVQPGCEGQQLPGPGNMDISTCSSGCSQYRTENQDLGTTSSELKHLPSLDPDQSGPHGSLRILCHALKQAVDLKSSDRRENCSPIVRRDFPELPNIRISSASPRDSPTQGYLTTSNSHYFAKGLEGQMPVHEQEMGIRKGEEDKDKMQNRALLGGYIAVKPSNVNTSEDSLESRLGSQKNTFKPFPEETREPVFSASSPWKADKENALQCSSKASLHPDIEINEQESRPKVDNHLQSVAKSKGSGHVHSVEKTHLENTKDNCLPASPMPGVHHKTTNGHSRAKSISVSSKSTRKSKRSSGLRINDYDNQCDVVFISQPITECHFESKRAVSLRKTARKSTRGYYYNGECCELPTVRTLAKASCVQANVSAPAPRPEVLTSPGPVETHVVSEDGGERSSLVSLPPTESFDKETQDTAEPCPDENNPPEASPLKQRGASPAETLTDALSPLTCPVLHAEDSSLSASSFHSAVVSSPQINEQELQEQLDISDVLQASSTMESCKSSSSHEDSGSVADFVPLSVSETAGGKQNSTTLEHIPEPSSLVNQEPFVSLNLPLNEEPPAGEDLLPPSEGPTATVDLPPSVESSAHVELPLPRHIDLAEPQAESPVLDSLGASVIVQAESPLHEESVCSGELVAGLRAASPGALPASVVPETLAHSDLESSEPPAVESVEMIPGRVDLELPQLPSSSDAAKLPASLQCTGANESTDTEGSVEQIQDREEDQAAKHETILPIVDTGENLGVEIVKDTGIASMMDESKEGDGKAPPASGSTETNGKEAASCKISTDKKRKREKKTQVASDRWLRSQQPPSPTEDSCKQPGLPTSLQLPQLQIKLSKSPGAKRFKREVHLDGAVFVSFPSDCFHETLLTDTDKTHEGESKQPPGEEDDVTEEQTCKSLLSVETAIEEGQNGDDKSNLGTMLKISLEANYDMRSVRVPVGISDEVEEQTDRNQEAPENSDSAVEVRKMLHPDHEIDCQPCPSSKNENKNATLEKSVRHKERALQLYNLRRTPSLLPVATVQKGTLRKEITESDSNVTEQQRTGDEEPIGFSSMEMLSNNKPRFVEWCAEEENQEHITNFNAQFMKVQKGWIQLEKEAQPAPKVKNKSDKLKEIWKSKKRTRKFKGSTEVQKLSPVQMLFMKAFNMSDICRWFMETTETKSLVIVKKLNTRLPGDIPLIKLPLQKGSSSGIYPSSLQAERLKKHLKKFAAMTPAKTTIKTQRLWARLQEGTEETEPEQVASTKQTTPSEVTPEHTVEVKTQPRPTTPVQTSSRILRKCSNLRCKLPSQQKVVKQEKHDCVTKQPSAESKPSRKTLCIKPLVSPKLAQQVKAAPLPTKSIPFERGGKERKGKGKLQEDTRSKSDLQPRKKKSLCETSRAQGQSNTSSKDKPSLKKASKLKHLEARATQKHTAVERSNKRASRNVSMKKTQLGKKKLPDLKGKANASQKTTLPSKQVGFAKLLKQKVVQDSSGQSLKVAAKKASSGKALTRSMKIFQQNNKAQSKRKLGANKNSSPCKRRRLDAK